ncbi:MAG: SDR family NAD(P)-dependent oxidoreductase [Pseudomonadota bacterium]
MPDEPRLLETHRISRLMRCMVAQRRRAVSYPPAPDLGGRTALVTGGTGGIGLETARGLLDCGATVVITARNAARAESTMSQLTDGHGARAARLAVVSLDLADLATVPAAAEAIRDRLQGAHLDILVENAGMQPHQHALTAQGHEIAFGTNVLGHFVLRRALADTLASDARVVIVTGDIYLLQRECTSSFAYGGPLGAMRAYCRSKLGNIWIARELQRRRHELSVGIVHPGVVATGLAGASGLTEWIMNRMLLSPREGARTSLFVAAQPTITPAGYYHNTRGHVRFSDGDPALDEAGARRLWEECERLTDQILSIRANESIREGAPA